MASPPDARLTGAEARLVAISDPLSGEVLPLTVNGVRIGRDASNDIYLPDLALSRAHRPIGATHGRDDLPDALLQFRSAGDVETPRCYGAIRRAKVDVNYLHRVSRTLDIKSTLETNR